VINLQYCVSHLQSIHELTPVLVLFGDPLHWYFNFLFWQSRSLAWSQFYTIIPSNTVLLKKHTKSKPLSNQSSDTGSLSLPSTFTKCGPWRSYRIPSVPPSLDLI
jgi:hypothetical protein